MGIPFLLVATAVASASPQQRPIVVPPLDGTSWVLVQRRVTIRVPRMATRPPQPNPRALPPIRWVEKRAPKCIAAESLAAAAVTRPDSVDLVLQGGKRVRAKLRSDCPALDFYSGFYMRAPKDGRICADRDAIRSRSGGECRIDAFRTLVPAH